MNLQRQNKKERKERKERKEMIVKGVLCQPNEIGKVIRVSTESGMLKAAINATQYEMTYFKDKTVAFVVDEFAKILGKRFNRAIFKDGSDVPETVLQGDFLIVGVDEKAWLQRAR